jgi:ankyrin repeat protein
MNEFDGYTSAIELGDVKGVGTSDDIDEIPNVPPTHPKPFPINHPPLESVAHHAARSGEVSVLRELQADRKSLTEKNGEGRLPLHDACLFGQLNAVRFFLEETQDNRVMVSTKDKKGMTPFHLASANGLVQVVELFLNKYGFKELNMADHNGCSAFHHAMQNKNYACAYILLEKGAQANPVEINILFVWTIALRLLSKAVTLLEKYNANLNTKSKNGLTFLETAVLEKDSKLVDKILASNNVDAQQRENALALARENYEKAKQCKQVEFWTPAYTGEDKQNLETIIKCLAKTFVETTEQKIETPKITQPLNFSVIL